MYYVYILYSPVIDRYFVGKTSNPDKSLERHNNGKNKHTKSGLPWKMIYKEGFEHQEEAGKKEQMIKSSKNREELVGFIQGKM